MKAVSKDPRYAALHGVDGKTPERPDLPLRAAASFTTPQMSKNPVLWSGQTVQMFAGGIGICEAAFTGTRFVTNFMRVSDENASDSP
ncbi:MAG TPA: hypothetical protein VNW15_13075 [Rhizomicrobium sp.]|jgi:hypothetical protein|nr:hypothetical protein [Rhizomicrobium sp.]